MPRVNTREASPLIATRTPFTSHGAITGVQDRENYVVRSYHVPILIIDTAARTATINESKYSRTTSTHQTQARLALSEFRELGYQIQHAYEQEEFETLTGYCVARY